MDDNTRLVLIAGIAAAPGMVGLYLSYKRGKDAKAQMTDIQDKTSDIHAAVAPTPPSSPSTPSE